MKGVSVADILSANRVSVASDAEGVVRSKAEALERLSELLAQASGTTTRDEILQVLVERERLQSTGVGGGVAVPHGSIGSLDRQLGAMLLCPEPIEFDAIDGQPVAILFALVGPKGAPAQHLKVLARVSRLLREGELRERLRQAQTGADAYRLICETEQR
jgi:PTS system nitrogen regulatory IIA component